MAYGPLRMKWALNLYPPFLFTGTYIKKIATDWKSVDVCIRKSLLTRNYVGTTFGGSLYAACDPFYMLMMVKLFGIDDYIIWDKAGEIDYKKPARSKITYRFTITDDDIKNINEELNRRGKSLPEFRADGLDKNGQVCCSVRKVVYIKKKNF